MTAGQVARRRGSAVLHVVGASMQSRRAPRIGWASPIRRRRGPVGPPRRHDDRRWQTDQWGWTDG
ncbi:hypothetical protein FF096_10635 [Micromonospora sp. CP22]|nr:hypothetical protein [Micromonospora sp. CP22]